MFSLVNTKKSIYSKVIKFLNEQRDSEKMKQITTDISYR